MPTNTIPPSWSSTGGERLAMEMAAAWSRGDCPRAEEFLERYPELLHSAHAAVRIVFEELCLRQERGERINRDELLRRFPQWKDELAIMLDCHNLVREQFPLPAFPDVGETLGGFRLIAELGRGTLGRVYLATQPTLADRPVVLKVTPRLHEEFQSLARLQHTHIIPLHGVYDFPARDLRALCQPYHGGATLARLHDALRAVPPDLRTGRSFMETLDQLEKGAKVRLPAQKGPRDLLAQLPYAEAVAWIGACLADALHYAHERGLIHLDVKPANVLLTAEGQPLLLDFHLARHAMPAGQMASEELGGTPAFMSPEQAEAYRAARAGLPMPTAIDHRSDIYSLGRMLYVLLGGKEPRPLHEGNRLVSVGLSDIVQRCLAHDSSKRYATMADLARDLRLHLAHRPLDGAPNRSWRERWHKWRQRRPQAPLWSALCFACLAVAGLVSADVATRRHEARVALEEARAQIARGAHQEALRTVARGKSLALGSDLSRLLDHEQARARRALTAASLHALVEKLHLFAGVDALPLADLSALDQHCGTLWQARTLLQSIGTDEESLRGDLAEFVVLWLDLQHRLGRENIETQAVLQGAIRLCGPSPVLLREQDPNRPLVCRTFWEHAALGRSLLREGNLEAASVAFARAVELRPQYLWANYYSGICAYRRHRPDDAIVSFSVAIALAPHFAELYYNRGLAFEAAGRTEEAAKDLQRATALAPHLRTCSVFSPQPGP